MATGNAKKRTAGSALLLIGSILLIVAMVLGWYNYSTQYSGGGGGVNFTDKSNIIFLPGQNFESHTNTTCTGSPYCSGANGSYTNSTAYSKGFGGGPALNHVATLYEALQYILIGAFVLGLIAAVLGLASRGQKQSWVLPVLALGIVALLLAIVAPAIITADNAAAIKADSSNSSGSGPWSSFYGGNSTTSWGPGIGYYLGIGGAVILLVGVAVWASARKPGVTEPASSTSAAAAPAATPASGSGSGGGTPPATPPP